MNTKTWLVIGMLLLIGAGPTTQPGKDWPFIYRSHRVSENWMQKMHAEFADKITLVDGEYREVARAKAPSESGFEYTDGHGPFVVSTKPPEIGEIRYLHSLPTDPPRVVAVTDSGAIVTTVDRSLVNLTGQPINQEIVFLHVEKPGRPLADGAEVPSQWLACIGVYEHIDAQGAKRTIQNYTPQQPLSFDEFVEALRSGVLLKRYKIVTKMERKTVGGQMITGGFRVDSTPRETKLVPVKSLVETVVP